MTEEQDWIVIGGGIAGISIAEILSRNGKSKNHRKGKET